MLRLRPSELTLTAEDVDETFRRLRHRQALRASKMAASRTTASPGRPVLQRGPQRSTREAMTALGDVPILRPQQAVLLSEDDDDDDDDDEDFGQPDSARLRNDDTTETDSASSARATVLAAIPMTLHTVQLPLRPRPDQHEVMRHPSVDQTTSTESLTHSPLSTTEVIDSSYVDQIVRPVTPPSNPTELRGGGRSSKHYHRALSRDVAHGPSPLHQIQRLSSPPHQIPPCDPVKSSPSQREHEPILHLRGYFKPLFEEPEGIPYSFRESFQLVPQTEPRRRSGRLPTLPRSLSSGSAPSYPVQAQLPDTSAWSSQYLFRTVQQDPLSRTKHSPSKTPYRPQSSSGTYHTSHAKWKGTVSRQFSSEASNVSAGFSYYGSLPSESRHSSSGQLGQDLSSGFQYDETTASRTIGHNLYPAGLERDGHDSMSYGGSLEACPKPQTAVSPLPSMPYARPHGPPSTSQASDRNTGKSEPHLDAATAATRDLGSPLDDYSEQYLRMSQAQHVRRPLPVEPQPSRYQPNGGGNDAFQPRQGSGSRQYEMSLNPHAPRLTTVQSIRQLTQPPSTSTNHSSQPHARSSHNARTSQRSSENVPVDPTPSDVRAARRSQVQTQRAAYEQLQSAVQAMHAIGSRSIGVPPSRFSVPPASTPRDISNQARTQAPPSRHLPHPRQDNMSSSPPPWDHIDPEPDAPLPPRHGSRQHSGPGPGPHRTHTRAYRQGPTTAAPALHLHPTRDSPQTSLALDHGSGTTSRRSRSPLMRATTAARTHRRVPVRQRDQENSLEGEVAAMRREEGVVRARRGEQAQAHGETMDETPPRVGRVERRVFE